MPRTKQFLRSDEAEDIKREAFAFDFAMSRLQRTAYGTRWVTISNGDAVEVPVASLNGLPDEITDAYLKEVNRRGGIPLHREHFKTILTCIGGGSGDHSMAALDSVYFKCCLETFKGIRRLIDIVSNGKPLLKASLTKDSEDVEQYLRKEFVHHLREASPCTMHSFTYAFATEAEIPPSPPEGYSRCLLCDRVHIFLENLRRATELVDVPAGDPDTPSSLMNYLMRLVNNVYTYIGHQFRKQHEKKVDEEVLKELDDETVYIIVDWKMKLLEMAYRQAMSEFFGQRGISWFGIMVYERKNATEIATDAAAGRTGASKYKVQFLDLTTDDSKEDGFASGAMILSGLREIKRLRPHICNFIVKSDGAGAFAGQEFDAMLATAFQFCGMSCLMHIRSEVGNGKTILDTHFASARLVLLRNVQAGGGSADIHCAADCARVLSLHGGMAVSSSGLVHFRRAGESAAAQEPISGYSSHLQRRFVYDENHCFLRVELWCMSFRSRTNPDMTVLASQLTSASVKADLRMHYADSPQGGELETAPGPQIRLSSEEREGFREMKVSRRKNKAAKAVASKAEKRHSMQQKITCSRWRQCPSPGCRSIFRSKLRLLAHINAGKHAYTAQAYEIGYAYQKKATANKKGWRSRASPTDGATAKDELVLTSVSKMETAIQDGTLVSLTDVNATVEDTLVSPEGQMWRLFEYSEVKPYDLPPGFARMRRGTNKNAVLSSKQLEYVLFVQGLGDSTCTNEAAAKSKTMPRTAEEGMRLAGTAAGQALFPGESYMVESASRRFRCEEWLDAQQLKGQMSKPRKQLVKQHAKILMNEQEAPNRAVLKAAKKMRLVELALLQGYLFLPNVPVASASTLRTWLAKRAEGQRRLGEPVVYSLGA